MSKIAVLGSLNMDLVTTVERQPVMGETIMGESFKTVCGGKGGNQATAIARLGGDIEMLGCVGDDAYGKLLCENLKISGAKTENIAKIGNTSGIAAITVAGGDNSIIVVAGANGKVSKEYVDSVKDAIAAAEYLVMQLEIPFDTVEYAAKLAKEVGTKVVFNPAPMDVSCRKILEYIDILVVNEHEAAMICEDMVEDQKDAEAAAEKLRKMGAGCVIVTLGAKGAVYLDEKKMRYIPAVPAKAVDTTAAGDSFIGAGLVKLSSGETLFDALSFAAKVSAIVVSRPGAADSIPFANELEELN